MSQQDEDPCKELLKRFGTASVNEAKHDVEEIIAVAMIVLLYVLCIMLSVTVDLATAIESIPALGMVGFHKREAVKAVAKKVPVKVPPALKRTTKP